MRSIHALAVSALILTAGCSNRVISATPLFAVDESQSDLKLRDGLWVDDAPDCKFAEHEPAERWPACANWRYIRRNSTYSAQWLESTTGRRTQRDYLEWSIEQHVLVPGVPVIIQTTNCPSALDPEEVPAGEPVLDEAKADSVPANFCFEALRPNSRDAAGRITEIEVWPVFCGPFPAEGNVTEQPWAGMTMVGENCTTAGENFLRDAAQRSFELSKSARLVGRGRWVRDDYH